MSSVSRSPLELRVQSLLGDKGAHRFAEAIGRSPAAFRRSLNDENSAPGRYVTLTCDLLDAIKVHGDDPAHVFAQVSASWLGSARLSEVMETVLGEDAVDLLSKRLGRSRGSIVRSASMSKSLAFPHLCNILLLLIRLRDEHGWDPVVWLGAVGDVRPMSEEPRRVVG